MLERKIRNLDLRVNGIFKWEFIYWNYNSPYKKAFLIWHRTAKLNQTNRLGQVPEWKL